MRLISKIKGWFIHNGTKILMGFAIILLVIGMFILGFSLIKIIFDPNYFAWKGTIDSKTASELGGFLSGFVGIFWSAAGVIFIYATFNAQKLQNEKQHFENQFFNLISTYHSLVDKTNYKDLKDGVAEGRDFISKVLKEYKASYWDDSAYKQLIRQEKKHVPEVKQYFEKYNIAKININHTFQAIDGVPQLGNYIETSSKELFVALYCLVYEKYQSKIGHLFRFLYNIFKFVIEEREKYGDDAKYISFIQAQLSNDELGLLFYNSISPYAKSSTGEEKFKNWLIKYDFFQNIGKDTLIDESHLKFYKTDSKSKN